MPLALLPASAQAYKPRSGPTIVLGQRPEKWLTVILKEKSRIKRPLNNVNQLYKCMTETFSGAEALWSLATMIVPAKPKDDLDWSSNTMKAISKNYQMISIEGYVVHVDMVSQHEITFKLTQDTIDSLIDYHRTVWSVDTANEIYNWPEKDSQLKKIQEDFKKAVNSYVYRTSVKALEGLEEDGAGELLEGRAGEVKKAIDELFLPLLPPPPRIVDVVAPAPVYYAAMQGQSYPQWWQGAHQQYTQSSPTYQYLTAPSEPWRVLGSSPSPTSAGSGHSQHLHSSGMQESHLPSPAPSYSQPFSSAGGYYGSTYTTSAPMMTSSAVPLPSVIAGCGPVASHDYNNGLNSPTWGYNDFTASYPIQI